MVDIEGIHFTQYELPYFFRDVTTFFNSNIVPGCSYVQMTVLVIKLAFQSQQVSVIPEMENLIRLSTNSILYSWFDKFAFLQLSH